MTIVESTPEDLDRIVEATRSLSVARDEWIQDANTQGLVTRKHHNAYIEALSNIFELNHYPEAEPQRTLEVADDVAGQIGFIALGTEKPLGKKFTVRVVVDGLAALLSEDFALPEAASIYVAQHLDKRYKIEPEAVLSESAQLAQLELGVALGC